MPREHVTHIDSPGKVARVDDVIDLRREMALIEREESWDQDFLAEAFAVDRAGDSFPIEVEHVAGGNLSPVDVIVGDRLGGVAVTVDQEDDVFGAAAGAGSGRSDRNASGD